MWVYQPQISSGKEQGMLPAPLAPVQNTSLSPSPQQTAAADVLPAVPSDDAPQPAQEHGTPSRGVYRRTGREHATRDCWMLAAAFLLGTAAAGWLQAMCDAQQPETLTYYLQSWQALFCVSDLSAAGKLFCTEYATLTATATLLLLLGFSAFGPVLIFLSAMLYGLGNGILVTRLFCDAGYSAVFVVLLLAAIPAALASGVLCVFGASALQVSSRIRAFSFFRQGGHAFSGSRALFGQYIVTLVSLVPVCGIATGIACLSRWF